MNRYAYCSNYQRPKITPRFPVGALVGFKSVAYGPTKIFGIVIEVRRKPVEADLNRHIYRIDWGDGIDNSFHEEWSLKKKNE